MLYTVGPNAGQLASLDLVPWESLAAGDTVRIIGRAAPYKGKFAINGHGTAAAPILIQGVPGPLGERAIIDANGATTRAQCNYGRSSAVADNEARSIICIIEPGATYGLSAPSYITIEGLLLINMRPESRFTDHAGVQHAYTDFAGAVWVDVGTHITINVDVDNCSQCVFSKSISAGATITGDILLRGCTFTRWGTPANTIHATYIQSQHVTYERCHYGPSIEGAGGNALKDRSTGTVVRWCYFENGAYALDLVEAEDWEQTAMADPAYRTTVVYGCVFNRIGCQLLVRYGGDHGGSEASFRKGTLWFWGNTVYMGGDPNEGGAYMFRMPTSDEHVQAFDNVFMFDPAIQFPSWRAPSDGHDGGIMMLGRNWAPWNIADSDPWHPVGGQLLGEGNTIFGSEGGADPVDRATWRPVAGSAIDGVATPPPAELAAYPLNQQLDPLTMTLSPRLALSDLGALENTGGPPPPANVAPIADFSTSGQYLAITFTDRSVDPDGAIVSRSWEFGDGQLSTATNPLHTYAGAGTYLVKLTATDNGSPPLSSSVTRSITVVAQPPPPPSGRIVITQAGTTVRANFDATKAYTTAFDAKHRLKVTQGTTSVYFPSATQPLTVSFT